MQILNLIKSHKPVFSIPFCVFTLCCRIIYKLSCFSHWFEVHTQDNPTLPNALTLSKDSSLQGCLLEQPNAFICFSAPTPAPAQPELQPPLLKMRSIIEGVWPENLLPSRARARGAESTAECGWTPNWLQPLWLRHWLPLTALSTSQSFPWENQETNAMTTGISLMLSRSAQGGFLTFFLFLRWHYSFVTKGILKIDTRF